MKKFIVSDLHGDGLIYCSIIDYLSKLSKTEDITLYINGDLIDRGLYSVCMLLDVIDKVNNGYDFKIEYLAGNHELMMYEAINKMQNGFVPSNDVWFANGGYRTYNSLMNRYGADYTKSLNNFLCNLKLYHKFDETLFGKKIVLVHAKCPDIVLDECDYSIKDNDYLFHHCVWDRKDYLTDLGNKDYFTIIGHTSNNNPNGCHYDSVNNVLNIDGGCSDYVCGYYNCDHVPLVEIENEKLSILTFNHYNDITSGNYFIRDTFVEMDKDEFEEKRNILTK